MFTPPEFEIHDASPPSPPGTLATITHLFTDRLGAIWENHLQWYMVQHLLGSDIGT